MTGDLCLPPEAVSLMGLTFRHDTPANLADNSEVLLPIYEATVIWNTEPSCVKSNKASAKQQFQIHAVPAIALIIKNYKVLLV